MMKLKKTTELWMDSNRVIHLPQPLGDDHTACGVPSDDDTSCGGIGTCMDIVIGNRIDCPDCIGVIRAYKNL